jgi:hypothetical protein
MKIIQSFWSNIAYERQIHNAAGWLSAEYHWMSWALSVLTLRKHYGQVEIFTDSRGKEVLIDTLALPYSHCSIALDRLQGYPEDMWALGKIFTYSLQNKPFMHVDGDIYLWEALGSRFEEAALIAQNPEVDFQYYYQTLSEMQQHFAYIPDCMRRQMNEIPVHSCNTGLIGGTRMDIFKKYAELSFELIHKNQEALSKINRRTFNIGFEQFLYYCLAKEHGVPVTYLIEREEDFDPTYRGFARFESVPYQTKFIHALGDFKRQPETCRHLARRLRQDYPEYYYRIIEVCKAAGVALDCRYYGQVSHPSVGFEPTDGLNGSGVNRPKEAYRAHYEQDVRQYRKVQELFSLPLLSFLVQKLRFSEQVQLMENINQDGILEQILIIPDIYTLTDKSISLDPLNMVLLDAFLEEPISIQEAIERVAPYFKVEEVSNELEKFRQLVSDRIKELMYWGALVVE